MSPKRDWHSEPEPANEMAEIGQPDPALQQEQAGPVRMTLYALGAAVILGVVFYGLNRPAPETVAAQQGTSSSASSAPAQQPAPSQDEASKGAPANATTGAAPKDGKQDQPPDQSKAGAKPDNKPDAQQKK